MPPTYVKWSVKMMHIFIDLLVKILIIDLFGDKYIFHYN
jgi:hypothetical protein